MEIFAGIDVGTTSVKGIGVDRYGKILFSYSKELSLQTPRPGWAQQNPEDWWSAVVEVLKDLCQDKRRLSAVSISGQMHSLVALDEHSKPVYPAILWCDQRTEKQCKELTEGLGGELSVINSFGNPILTGFTLPKLLWLKENEPELFSKIRKWLLPKDYIVKRLTGRSTIDYSDASGTSALSIGGTFLASALELCGIKASANPELVDSGTIAGYISGEILPILEGVPVVVGGADNAAAAFGCGVERPGDVMVSLGTSGTVVAVTKTPVPDPEGRIHLFRHVSPDSFYHMAVILSATNSLNWFKDRFASDLHFAEVERLVAASPAGSNGVIFLPYLNGERTPHRDPNARGTLVGVSSFHSRGDVLRSIYEGVVFALREGTELISDLGTEISSVRIVGGGSRSKSWCQMIADNLGREVWLPGVDEGAAYGTARLAASALGFSSDSWITLESKFSPDLRRKQIYDEVFDIYKDLYRSLKNDFRRLGELQNRIVE